MRFSRHLSVVALALPLALAVGAQGQAWRGHGRIQGTVTNIDGDPIAGAEVYLTREGPGGGGPQPASTDPRGRWAVIGLAGGRWRIKVEAQGFLTSDGWATVAGDGPSPSVDVELQSLDMVPPSFYEGNPATIVAWLERGNTLLSQGRYAEARADYEKALAVIPNGEKPKVLRSVARTYFLEGDQRGAVTALKRSLLLAPSDSSSRKLLTTLMEELGRGQEARDWLARLEREGPKKLRAKLDAEPATSTVTSDDAGRQAEIRPEPPRPNRIGRFTTRFTTRSPVSGLAEIARRYDREPSKLEVRGENGPSYELEKETFEVLVPESYRPDRPAALLVWVSPTPRGGISTPALIGVLADKGVLWVGANHSGNRRSSWVRLGLALDAAYNMRRLYNIDPSRVYVAGYSGGGRIASALGMLFTDVFHGALCLMGVDYYRDVPIPYRPGTHWAAGYPRPAGAALELAEKRNRYVLVSGERDFNRVQTRVYAARLRQDGFQHVTYLEIPGGSHYTRLPPDVFARALDALDGRQE